MITGFHTETSPLNEHELLVAHEMIPFLKKVIGEENAAKNTKMARGMEKWLKENRGVEIKLPEARMRKILNYIRRNYIPRLCGTSSGYFVAKDISELLSYRESLRQRIGAIQEVFDVVDQECELELKGQQLKMIG